MAPRTIEERAAKANRARLIRNVIIHLLHSQAKLGTLPLAAEVRLVLRCPLDALLIGQPRLVLGVLLMGRRLVEADRRGVIGAEAVSFLDGLPALRTACGRAFEGRH